MRLYFEEMKKIWRLPIAVLLIITNLLLFFMMFADQLDYSYNEEGEQRLLADLFPLVGGTVEPEELDIVRELLEKYKAVAEDLVRDDPIYIELGNDAMYEGFWALEFGSPEGETPEEEEAREARWVLHNELWSALAFGEYLEPSDYAYWKISSLSGFITEYEIFESESDFETNPRMTLYYGGAPQLQVYEQLAEAGAHRNLFAAWTYRDTTNYITMCVVLVMVSIAILILPYLTTDNQYGMPQMQWSSKTGRGTLRVQFAAVMSSALILMTVQLAVLLGVFLTARTEYFTLTGQHIFGLLGTAKPIVVNPQFGQFLAISAVISIVVNLGAAGVFFVLSYRNSNYVTLLLKALPAAAALGFAAVCSVLNIFSANNLLYTLFGVRGMEIVLAAIVFITGAALCITALRGARKRELL